MNVTVNSSEERGGALALLAACVAALLALFFLTACSGADSQEAPADPEPEKLHISILLDGPLRPSHAPVILAKTLGMFDDAGLDVDLSVAEDARSALDALQGQRAVFCTSSQLDLSVVMGADEPYSVLAVAALEPAGQAADVSERPGGDAEAVEQGYPLLLVASDLFLVRREDDARAAVEAVEKAREFAKSHESRCRKDLEAFDASAKASLWDAFFEDLRQQADGAEWGRISQAQWDACFEHAHASKFAANPIPAHHGYSMDYLDDTP